MLARGTGDVSHMGETMCILLETDQACHHACDHARDHACDPVFPGTNCLATPFCARFISHQQQRNWLQITCKRLPVLVLDEKDRLNTHVWLEHRRKYKP